MVINFVVVFGLMNFLKDRENGARRKVRFHEKRNTEEGEREGK